MKKIELFIALLIFVLNIFLFLNGDYPSWVVLLCGWSVAIVNILLNIKNNGV